MAFLVTVTFDLRGAEPHLYPLIQRDLKKIDFSKMIMGKKEIEKKLPSNTFIAKFDLENFDRGSEVTEYVKNEIREIFKKHNVAGRYFVAVGKKWAWMVGNVR